ncbi:MAG: hypothetical protein KY432_12155, partial [Acidobacteria bacterium]|nr:hypothetical protein [Acidobacteriota bacterium]
MRRRGPNFVGVLVVTVLVALTQMAAVTASAKPFEVKPIDLEEVLEQSTSASGFVTTRAVTGTDPAGDLRTEPFGLWGAYVDSPTGTIVSIQFPQWFIEKNMSHAQSLINFVAAGVKGKGDTETVPWNGVSVDQTTAARPESAYDIVRVRMEKFGGDWLLSVELAQPLEPDDGFYVLVHIQTPNASSQMIRVQGLAEPYGFKWAFFHPDPTTFATYHRDYQDLAGATITQVDPETVEIEIVAHGQFPGTSDSSLDMSRYWIGLRDAEGLLAGVIGAEVDAAGWTAYYQPRPNNPDFDFWWGERRTALEQPTVAGNRLRLRVPLSVLPLRNELKADVGVHLFLNTDFGVVFATSIDTLVLEPLSINDAPEIVVSALPGAMLQNAGEGGATTTFTLTNVGDFDTTVTLTRDGDFFTLDPATFVLGPGASQQVVVTGEAEPVGVYSGTIVPTGLGVPAGLSIAIRMVVAAAQEEASNAVPESNRVDVAAPAEQDLVEASIRFRNTGEGALTGLVVADVPWLQIMEPVVEIEPDGEVQIPFVINRTLRPDSESPFGSITGTLALEYLDGSGPAALRKLIEARNGGASVSTTLVTVTDTAKPTTTIAAPPKLGSNQVAVFLAGLGHVQSSVGTFISDLHLTSLRPLSNLSFFYTPVGEATANSTSTTIASL